jgi:hypothetical protein
MMDSTDLRVALERLIAADPANADRDMLSDTVKTSSQLRSWLASVDLKCSRRARQLAEAGRSEPADSMNSRQGRRSNKEGKKISDREDVGESMGGFEGALTDGKVSGEHLDALAAAMKNLDDDLKAKFREREAELLKHALTEGVDVFARRCRQIARQLIAKASAGKSDADELDDQRKRARVKHWIDKITGMHHTHLELDPVRDAALWSVVNAHLAKLRQNDGNAKTPWNEMQVNAFLAAVEAGVINGDGASGDSGGYRPGNKGDGGDTTANSGGGLGRRVPEVTMLIDWQTLISGMHDNSVCETEDGVPLPVSTVRRLCCDAEVLPAVLNGEGEILDVGRSERTANRQQRRALRAMHRTCGHPDCTVGFSACRIHHIKFWWKHLGRTDMDNLLPLCERHHHLVHEGGWALSMTPDRVTTWTRPDGVIAYTGNSIDRARGGVGPPQATTTREPAST